MSVRSAIGLDGCSCMNPRHRPKSRPPASASRDEPRIEEVTDIAHADLDQDALRVVSKLRRSGYEAYFVGGCVRDLKLGRAPKDYDLATAAHPRQVKRLFQNGRIIGRRFKLVHVFYGDHIIETATFRREPDREADGAGDLLITEDNEYGTAAEDARRRDFTINGLFLDPDTSPVASGEKGPPRIIDFVGGLEDLEAGVLRAIGDPLVRFAEDPVRILRAVKFATRLGFRIEEATWAAMCELAPELERSSRPRILEELLRLFRSGTALGAFRMLRACGALRVLLPTVDEYLGVDPSDVVASRRSGKSGLPRDSELAQGFWRLLEALDAYVHEGYVPPTSVCIAVLFVRIVEQESDAETRTLPGPPPPDAFGVTTEVMEPFVLDARVPRRDFARARRIIAHQRRFTQARSKRFRPLIFMRSEDFAEALDLFRLRSVAWGQGWDVYEAWVERYERALEASGEEVDAVRRKTRRRRGRRRKRGDDSNGA